MAAGQELTIPSVTIIIREAVGWQKRTTDRKMDTDSNSGFASMGPSSSPRSGLPYGRSTLTLLVHDS